MNILLSILISVFIDFAIRNIGKYLKTPHPIAFKKTTSDFVIGLPITLNW